MRNALAHFRPLKYDDVELIKQNVKHAFVGIEQCLAEMTQTYRVVPTNTEEQWYRSLITLGSNCCTVKLFQDKSERWIRIEIDYACASINSGGSVRFRSFNITTLLSPKIIKAFPAIARHCTFMSEKVPYVGVTQDNVPNFRKEVSLVFGSTTIVEHNNEINDRMKDLLLKVQTETELVQKDDLARGDLIDLVNVSASLRKDSQWWSTNTEKLKCKLGESDPPEYWGEIRPLCE